MKNELIALLCRKSFKYSETPTFKLVSGRTSRFYVNCKPTTLSPRGMFLTGHLMLNAIGNCGASAVGGLTCGADPIAMATAFASELEGQPVKAFSIRKTQKDHGIVKWVEGDIQAGEKVVVIDDVATTGGSTSSATRGIGCSTRDSNSHARAGGCAPTASALVLSKHTRRSGPVPKAWRWSGR